jgi:hypothetical protein
MDQLLTLALVSPTFVLHSKSNTYRAYNFPMINGEMLAVIPRYDTLPGFTHPWHTIIEAG